MHGLTYSLYHPQGYLDFDSDLIICNPIGMSFMTLNVPFQTRSPIATLAQIKAATFHPKDSIALSLL